MMKVRKALQRKKGRWLCLALALATLLSVATASAAGSPDGVKGVDPVNQPDNYSSVLYDNTNGLPTAEANAIVQTAEGFIWIGSYAGLIRYDGNTFERMDSTGGLSSIKCLYVDSRDRLWMGTNDNGVAVMENGEFRMWRKLDGLKSAHTRSIAEDENGTIYVATTCGVAMIDAQYNLSMMEDPAIAEANMRELRMGEDGIIYGLTNFGDILTIRDGEVRSFLPVADNPVGGVVSTMLPDPRERGKVYFEGSDFVFYHATLGESLTDLEPIDIAPLSYVYDMAYLGDALWICASNGIGVLEDGVFHLLENLPMNNSVCDIMTDYLGNLWFASSRQGVMKVVPNQFSDLFERYDLPTKVVNSTCVSEDKLFIGTDTGLMVIDENGPMTNLPLTKATTASGEDLGEDDLLSLLDGCRIRSIIRDSRGQLWISTWRKIGLLRYSNGEVVAFSQEHGLLSNSLRAVDEQDDGSILVAVTGGVNVIRGDQVVAGYGEDDGITNTESLTVSAGLNGDIVLGSNGGGLYLINDSGVRNINVEDGLPSDIVMRLKRDTKHNVVWIVTSSALAYMTPDNQITTVQKFPYTNNFDLYENSKGDMWVLSSNGIYVTPVEELLANGEINTVHYGLANGMSCITTANSYSELTAEGDLYIAGSTGVCQVNIEQPFENVDDMKATVPFVVVDGQTLYPDGDGVFTIPSNTQKLTVYSFVFNYSLSDPQVSYRLEGLERHDTTIRRSEMVPVDYTNLRGGTYHFVMQLKDSMGRGDKEVSVGIVKEKAFFEQVWFYVLVGLAVALVIAALVHTYIRRRMLALEKKHKEEAERERIEGELQMASRIQTGILPNVFPAFPDRKEFDIFASMDPAKEVGGDFYDYFFVDDDHLCMVMADVSGKGVPAALFMMTARTILKTKAQSNPSLSPKELLNEANAALTENDQEDMFVTVWLGILELSTGELTYSDAGHEKLLLYQDGTWKFLPKNGGVALAMWEPEDLEFMDEQYQFHDNTIRLKPGDAIFQYTDGVTEATDANNELFGDDRLLAAMNSAPSAKPEDLLPHVRRQIDAFVKDAPQFDDITMLGLEYRKRQI